MTISENGCLPDTVRVVHVAAHQPEVLARPYVHVACTLYYGLLALGSAQQECELSVLHASGEVECIRGVIGDVYTHGDAEYLQFRHGKTFRLDQIEALNGNPVPPMDSAHFRRDAIAWRKSLRS